MDPGTALAVIQFADQCLKYGEELVRRVQNYRHAEVEARALTITIEVNWMKTEAQINFLKKISYGLDPYYSDVQSRMLSELEGKLKTATLRMDQLLKEKKDKEMEIEKPRDPSFSAMIKALEKMAPKKKLKYAFKKDSLEEIIDDLENWQKRFDPSWMLIMRMADSKIDRQLLEEEKKPAPRRAGFIIAAKGVRDAARESASTSMETLVPTQTDLSIFKPASILCGDESETPVPFSDAQLGRMAETKEWVLVDVMVCNPIADVKRTEKDVRKLARILANIDPSTFGLLACRGVVKSSSPSSLDVLNTDCPSQNILHAFKFLFAIPSALKSPKSLRNLLIEGDASTPLNSRFDLAKQLTNSLLFIHSSQFVHKNIRPETIIVFENDENKIGSSFLVGFEKFRPAEGMTYRTGDGIWERNLYHHPSRQGTRPDEDYVMQHDIYSLGVVLLELGLWKSFVTYAPVPSPSDPAEGLPKAPEASSQHLVNAIPPPFIFSLSTEKDARKRATAIKSSLVSLASTLLPAKMGSKYTDVVFLCLQCLDDPPADEETGEKEKGCDTAGAFDDVDDDGIVVGVRYIERILLRMQEIRAECYDGYVDCERELTALIEFSKPKYKDEAVFVHFFGWFQTDDAICVAMEYIPLGDLENNLQELEKSRHTERHTGGYGGSVLSGKDVKDVTTQILEGVKIMHAEGFAHRDLKPQNVLVVQTKPTWWVKLGDFGLSKKRTEATVYRSHAGTESYMAPEMFYYVPGLDPESSEYTNAVDIWAVGCITYRILTGKPPFSELWSLQRYCSKSNLPIFLQGLSEVEMEAEQFVRQLLAPQPGERLTANAALEHPWLSKNAQTAMIEVSHINQRSSHYTLPDTTQNPISKDIGPPPAYSQGQYNYNTASHAGLRSNYHSQASQNATVTPAPVNQWPEADRLRMREPMLKAFEVEQFDALEPLEDYTIIAEEEEKLKSEDEPIKGKQKVPKLRTWESLYRNLRQIVTPTPSSQRELKANEIGTNHQRISLKDELWKEEFAKDINVSLLNKSPRAIPQPHLVQMPPLGDSPKGNGKRAFNIHIDTFTGYRFQLHVHPLDRVLTIKRKLSETRGLPTEQLPIRGFRLNFQDKLLDDYSTLESCGVEADSRIHCRWIN